MDWPAILLLGLVQGITEWIPVSSKTQDTIVYLSFLDGDPALVVPILLYLHLGTFFAAILYFRSDLREMASELLKRPRDLRLHAGGRPGFLTIALLCTGLIGIPLLLLEQRFFPSMDGDLIFLLMGAGLVLTGFLLFYQKGARLRGREEVTWRDGILTGILQGFSVLPGISRAGTSTTGLIWRGFEGESSFHLSFLLSIPTVLLAEMVFYLGGGLLSFPLAEGLALALASFIFGYITIDIVLRVVKRVNLAYVCLVMGLLIIAVSLAGAG
ncbi:MAG: undecaprenyl-diphosphate phosphatase [Methanomicrobiales archaeon]|nr:undecaprenyl-diphosphate phosphatase [Methanomicrobiales archaeon]